MLENEVRSTYHQAETRKMSKSRRYHAWYSRDSLEEQDTLMAVMVRHRIKNVDEQAH